MKGRSPGGAPHGRSRHRTLQLCAQVQEALAYALSECSSEVLQDLLVVAVEPAPDESHLLVVVQDTAAHGVALVLAELDDAKGHLRHAVAESIVRRRAPLLSFTVAPP